MSRVSTSNRDILLAAWNSIDGGRHAEAVDEFFHDDFVRHAEEGDYTREEYRSLLATLHVAFPDLRFTLSELVAENDLVAWRWVGVGTHQSMYMGVPPTHKRVKAEGLTISRFRDGRVAEEWASWNKVAVLHRLGIFPIDQA
jgi:steroid delta-isomerase-like uncharacterized protein